MNCSKCGGKVATDAAFCSKCGAPINATDADDDEAGGDGVTRARANARRVASDGASRKPEEDLWTGSFSPLAMVGPAVGCAMISLLAAIAVAVVAPDTVGWTGLAVFLLLTWGSLALTLLYRRLTVRYRLSTYRFFHDTGLLSRTANRIEVIDIDDVTVHQGLIERMFGVGTIHIDSSDATHPDLDLPGIEDVRSVADLIDGTRRAERLRRGLHLEAI